MRARRVQQAEASAALVGAPVGEEHGGGAAAEEAVGEEHGAVVAPVPVLGDVLGGDDEREAVAVLRGAKQAADEVDADHLVRVRAGVRGWG